MGVAMINKENIVEEDNFIIKSYSPKIFLNDFIKKHPISKMDIKIILNC